MSADRSEGELVESAVESAESVGLRHVARAGPSDDSASGLRFGSSRRRISPYPAGCRWVASRHGGRRIGQLVLWPPGRPPHDRSRDAAAGWLSWLDERRVPRAVLIGGSACGGDMGVRRGRNGPVCLMHPRPQARACPSLLLSVV
jgi:hypothetical protein